MTLGTQRGQVVIEYVLIMVVVLSFTMFILKEIRDRQMLASLVASPWSILTGMIENGTWGSPAKTRPFHPSLLDRHLSLNGEDL